MNRRSVLKSALLLATMAGSAKFAWAKNPTQSGKPIFSAWFNDGVHSAAQPDGSWNLWVRPDPRDKKVKFVRVRLQVAEDPTFHTIIAQKIYMARKDSHYILRTNFTTKFDRPELYYRFVALDTGSLEKPNELIVSPVGVLKPFVEN